MRIPHYLYLAPSGVWHFRQRLPAQLAKQAGQAAIKRSLGTRDLLTAQRCALELAHRYAEAFAVSRGWGVSMDDKPTLDASVQALKKRRVYEIELPSGTKLKTDGTQAEHDRAMQALSEIERIGFHSLRKTAIQELQTLGVSSEVRASYVGHELDDEHHASYSRAPTAIELLEAVSKLDWKLDLKILRELLH